MMTCTTIALNSRCYAAGDLWLSYLNIIHSSQYYLFKVIFKGEASLKLQQTLSHTHILGQ